MTIFQRMYGDYLDAAKTASAARDALSASAQELTQAETSVKSDDSEEVWSEDDIRAWARAAALRATVKERREAVLKAERAEMVALDAIKDRAARDVFADLGLKGDPSSELRMDVPYAEELYMAADGG